MEFQPHSLETSPLAQLFTNTADRFSHPYTLPPIQTAILLRQITDVFSGTYCSDGR